MYLFFFFMNKDAILILYWFSFKLSVPSYFPESEKHELREDYQNGDGFALRCSYHSPS